MWTLTVYRSARELVGIYQDLRELYNIAVEACRTREPSPAEIELSSRFRECCFCAYEEPLFCTEPEPHDTGWTVIAAAGPTSVVPEAGNKGQE